VEKILWWRAGAAAVEGRRRARAGVAALVGVVVIEGRIQNGHGAQLLLVLGLHPQLVAAPHRRGVVAIRCRLCVRPWRIYPITMSV
jgi:hypothetical protein